MKNIYKHLATNLKALRQERCWSLDKTAEETGVSKAMLGQIERQESSPTIATLWKIANGFNTSFSILLEEFPLGQTTEFHADNIQVKTLFPFDKQTQIEIFHIELASASEHLSTPHNAGVLEYVIVIEGKMEVLVDGIWKPLSSGERLRFHADQPHGYRNKSRKNASFHNIIHYPASSTKKLA